MKTSIRLMQISLVILTGIGFSSCEKRADDGVGKAEFSLSLPEESNQLKSGSIIDSSIVSYQLLVSVEDLLGNSVFTDTVIPLYAFGTSFVSVNVEIKKGEYKLTKFMVLNPEGIVVYAAPLGGSPLAYLVNRPLPLVFNIIPDQVTRIIPEVLVVGDQIPKEFGYASFGIHIINALHFWTICILDNPLIEAPTQLTTAKLTVYANNGWHYTIKLEAGINHLIIQGGSPVYYFLLEKEGYMSQNMEFTLNELKATTSSNPLVLKIPWDSTNLPFEALYSLSAPTIDGQIDESEWSNANKYPIVFTRNDDIGTREGTIYLQNDGTWLFVGVKTNSNAGWDVYLSIRLDGNNDNILNGQSVEPHTDINIEYPSPGGWSGYVRYDYLVPTTLYPTTKPAGTQSASYGSINVSYEYKIKLSDLNTSPGQIVGFYIYNLVDANPEHGYEFPIRLTATDPSQWGHIKINN